jgi:hypothetical protein
VAAGGLAALLVVSGRAGRTFGAATVAGSIAVLAVPLALSVRLVGAGESDASRLPALPGAQRAAFLRYTRAHGGGRASAVAVYNPTVLAGAIAEGAGPILPLTSWAGRPLVRLAELRAQTAAGRVRLALLGNPRCDVRPPAHPRHCLPTVSWISAHGRNVSRAAGVRPPFALYRLSPRTGRARPSPIEVRAADRIEHRLG